MKCTFVSFIAVVAVGAGSVACSSPGMSADPDQALHDWQLRRLMQPMRHELEKERRGSVYIYDSLTQHEVEKALDIHFDRIQHMMFMGTVKTGADGQPLQDEQTGQYIQESGSCGE